ncbi:MAG: alpha/beta fold hydrolase [Gemmatimonadota bacterium]
MSAPSPVSDETREFAGCPAGGLTEAPGGRPIVTRIGDHEIHALEFGAGEEPIILIHGLSGSSRWWVRNIPALAAHWRILVPDLIGFGRSRATGPLPDMPEIALLLLEWIDSMALRRVHLVGHSMGGQISIHLAVHSPERVASLILVDAAGIPRPMTPRSLFRFAAEAGPLWRWGDPAFLPVIARDAWTAGPRVLLRAIRHIVRDDVRPLLPELRVPTLIIWGERDTLVPLSDASEFHRLIAGARLAVLRGAAHNPMVDRPAAFNRIVSAFLDGKAVGTRHPNGG